MTDTLDRLRRLQGLRRQRRAAQPDIAEADAASSTGEPSLTADGIGQQGDHPHEELAAGEVIENAAGSCYVVTARYPLSVRHGPHQLGAILAQSPDALATFHPQFGLHRHLDYTQALFLDTETTGLGAGAGIYAFMVGVGSFEPPAHPTTPADDLEFVVRQFFMRSPAEEGALLVALADLMERHAMTVTFNGRTFDLPLLRTRYRQNAWGLPLDFDALHLLDTDQPHLDLLHPARRLWRKRLGSCRLINLETQILGLSRSADDVPGQLIPQLYVDYVRTGNAREMNRVFYHNREDIVSMISLAEWLTRIYAASPTELEAADLVGAEWAALGQSYARAGQADAAEAAFLRAADTLDDRGALAEVFRCLGALQKRQQRWNDAAATWQRWLTTVPGTDPTPYVELAKYCEWQTKDYEQAAMWTGWALHSLQAAPAWQQSPGVIADLTHRLARLQRKSAAP